MSLHCFFKVNEMVSSVEGCMFYVHEMRHFQGISPKAAANEALNLAEVFHIDLLDFFCATVSKLRGLFSARHCKLLIFIGDLC